MFAYNEATKEMSVMLVIDIINEELEATVEERFFIETLAVVIMNFDGDNIDYYKETVHFLYGQGSCQYAPRKLDFNMKNRGSPLPKPSIKEPPVLELKPLPSHLRYEYL